MLSSLLSQVGTVLSKLFIFSSFVPTLVFAFINGLLLFIWHSGFHDWVSPQISGTAIAFYFTSALIAIAVVAYVLFTLNNSLRVILERARFLPPPARNAMSASEQKRLQSIVEEYLSARNERREIDRLRDRDQRLERAITQGAALTSNNYDAVRDPAATKLVELQEMMTKNVAIPSAELDRALAAFAVAIAANNQDYPAGGRHALDEQHLALLETMDYAVDRWKFEETDACKRQQFEFGPLTPLPTRLGNVGQSMQGYAISRYNLDLDLLWTRFFNALRQDKDMFGAIEDAKTQLDFLVASCWLSAITTIFWMIGLVAFGHSVVAFLVLVAAGALSTYAFYAFAVRSYGVFADVVRSSIDQDRFFVLDAFRLTSPGGLREERQVWDVVNKLVAGGGEYLELSYRARDKTPSG